MIYESWTGDEAGRTDWAPIWPGEGKCAEADLKMNAHHHISANPGTDMFSLIVIELVVNIQQRIRHYFYKNPAYGRHQLSRPMRIVVPIQI